MKFNSTPGILPLYRFFFFLIFCLFIFCLPFSKAIVEISIALIFVGWLLSSFHVCSLESTFSLKHFFQKCFNIYSLAIQPIVAFFLLILIASALINFIFGSDIPLKLVSRGFLKYAKWFIVFYASVELFRHPRWLSPMMKVMSVGLVLILIDALAQALLGYDLLRGNLASRSFPIPRLTASFDKENAFASYLILVAPPIFCALLYWIRNMKNHRRWALFGIVSSTLLFLFVFVQTRTRSAWIGMIIGLFALLILKHQRRRLSIFLISLMMAVFFVPWALNGINEKLSQKGSLVHDMQRQVQRDEEVFKYPQKVIQGRLELWKQGWTIFKSHPWFGTGPNTYNLMVPRYPIPGQTITPYAHNSYLQTLAELGIFGLLPLLWVLIWIIVTCGKTIRDSKTLSFYDQILLGLFVGLIAFLIKAAFDTEFHSFYRINLFWFLAGMAMGTTLIIQKNQKEALPVSRLPQKFKILHAANYQSLKHLVLPHMIHQKKQGHDVFGLTSDQAPYKELSGLRIKKIPFEAQTFKISDEFSGFLELMKAFYQESPDIVHTHNVKFGIFGRLAARAAGVPYVFHTAHGIYRAFGKESFKNKGLSWLEKVSAFCSEIIFFVSPFDLDQHVREKVAAPSQVFLIGNGIDLEHFNPALITSEMKRRKREELKIKPQTKVIGMVGRLVQDKGFKEFFEAAQKLSQSREDCCFLVIASHYLRKDNISESIAAKGGIQDKTLFLYDREDMAELYGVMDILVHPSWREGLPRVLMEAAAMGVFCIATDIPGNRNVIQDETYGKLVPVQNPQVLYQSIVEALDSQEECQKRAQKAQDYARKNFDVRDMIRRLDEGYQKVIP